MRFIALLFFLTTGFLSMAQILTPARWTYSASNPAPSVGEEIELIFKVNIDKDWYLYASEFPCEDGPIKTTINFKPHPSFNLAGKLRDINAIDKHDKIFDCDIKIFRGIGEFRQKIKILKSNLTLSGDYEYQVCTDVDGKCIPFNDDFVFSNIKVSGSKSEVSDSDGDMKISNSPDSLQLGQQRITNSEQPTWATHPRSPYSCHRASPAHPVCSRCATAHVRSGSRC